MRPASILIVMPVRNVHLRARNFRISRTKSTCSENCTRAMPRRGRLASPRLVSERLSDGRTSLPLLPSSGMALEEGAFVDLVEDLGALGSFLGRPFLLNGGTKAVASSFPLGDASPPFISIFSRPASAGLPAFLATGWLPEEEAGGVAARISESFSVSRNLGVELEVLEPLAFPAFLVFSRLVETAAVVFEGEEASAGVVVSMRITRRNGAAVETAGPPAFTIAQASYPYTVPEVYYNGRDIPLPFTRTLR